MLRRLIPLTAAMAILVPAGTGMAAEGNVPIISDVHAHPRTFCAKKSDACPQPGTRITFTISTAAKVRAVMRPRFEYQGNLVEFVRPFPKGTNSFQLRDHRLRRGTWQLRLQGTNGVGTGPVAIIHLHVAKHR